MSEEIYIHYHNLCISGVCPRCKNETTFSINYIDCGSDGGCCCGECFRYDGGDVLFLMCRTCGKNVEAGF